MFSLLASSSSKKKIDWDCYSKFSKPCCRHRVSTAANWESSLVIPSRICVIKTLTRCNYVHMLCTYIIYIYIYYVYIDDSTYNNIYKPEFSAPQAPRIAMTSKPCLRHSSWLGRAKKRRPSRSWLGCWDGACMFSLPPNTYQTPPRRNHGQMGPMMKIPSPVFDETALMRVCRSTMESWVISPETSRK